MITNVLVTGGTHGNELTGVNVVKHWEQIKPTLKLPQNTPSISCTITNSDAVKYRTRFIDQDLNRQFSLEKLALNENKSDELLCKEERLAQSLNKEIGPKSSPSYDLVIDFHNTTANLGPCLIILCKGEFEVSMARYVKSVMPSSVMLLENEKPYEDFPYLCTLGKHGVMIELGNQAHGVNDPSIYLNGLQLLQAILDFCRLYNENNLPALMPVECYHLTGEVKYPDGAMHEYMIHPDLFGHDFEELKSGDPCFISVDGETVQWEGNATFPHFIGEVAYQHLGMAFSTSDRILL